MLNVSNTEVGRVAIPKGSTAEMTIRKLSDKELALDLNAIDVGGRRYTVGSDASTRTGAEKEGVAKTSALESTSVRER